jgi:guanosine-3',5'-bis(diphosphate) 3'-pyrophosphohydrolase
MADTPDTSHRKLLDAVAFAARAHRHQLRKDGRTPYVSHVFRVCLVVRDVFGVTDPRVLMAAVLHDTVEDTTTDFDDLAEQFGPEIASWVSSLSKDMRRPFDAREEAYCRELAAAGWEVQVCKLADIFDNVTDSADAVPERRARTLSHARRYLEALRGNLKPQAAAAWQTVANLVQEASAR